MATHSQSKYCSSKCSREGERKSWRAYGDRNREKRREYHRKFYARNREKIIARTVAYHKTPAGKEAIKKTDARQRAISPEKGRARGAVKAAIVAGRLSRQPCVKCGNLKVEAHHADYSKPLDVIWVCPKHHRELHKKEN